MKTIKDKDITIYQLLNSEIEIGDNDNISKLYVNFDDKTKVKYITTDEDGSNHNYFESTIHPEKLDKEQRRRVLHYCLSSFDDDEIVNYNDLFLQFEFITEANIPKSYELENNRFICGSCGDSCSSYKYNEEKDIDECVSCQ